MGIIRIAPLSSSFFAFGLLGFTISAVLWNSGRLPDDWGFTFCLTFILMLLASFISMTRADVDAQLALDHHLSKSGRDA
ncbi:MAG TPA: hypothetical protein VJK52_00325 [Candidatus Nanoarchaeia archaeon]|nr:hypothetical protein [Candidatus Nanoarchaeia archaeon]